MTNNNTATAATTANNTATLHVHSSWRCHRTGVRALGPGEYEKVAGLPWGEPVWVWVPHDPIRGYDDGGYVNDFTYPVPLTREEVLLNFN